MGRIKRSLILWLLKTDDKELRQFIVNSLTRNILKAITEEDILRVANREWLVGKRKLAPGEVEALKEEASGLVESELWNLAKNDVGFIAWTQMSDHAKTVDDILFGKAMVYNLAILDKFFRNIKDLK